MAIDTQHSKLYFPTRTRHYWWGYFYLALLLIAAAVLFFGNLGVDPIDKLQEGYFVQVGKEIWQAPEASMRWLFPTFLGKPLVLHAPLYPNVLALALRLGGESPWALRIPGACFALVSVAIVYGIGRELFRFTLPTLLTCCVFLTFFPIAYLPRLATPDATLLCFQLLGFWGLLRSRRDLRWSMVVGFGISLTGLTHTWSLLPLTIIMVLFLRWDTPRLLASPVFWFGLTLGLIPLIGWFLIQCYFYEPSLNWQQFYADWQNSLTFNPRLSASWLLQRPLKRHLASALTYFSPWMLASIYGIKFARGHLNWAWTKFITVTGVVGLVWSTIGLLEGFIFNDAPLSDWYMLPLYFVTTLLASAQLYQLYLLPSYVAYPASWQNFLGFTALSYFLLGMYGKLILLHDLTRLELALFASTTLTCAIAAYLFSRRDAQFIPILIWGSYVSLLLFFL